MLFPRRGFILLCFLCYGYLSPTGKRQIVLYSFYGYLSPTGKPSDHNLFFLWLFIPYGESSTYLFSRREFISIEKHYKKMLFPRRGFILLCLLCYGYLSPTGKPSDRNLFFLWFFIPYGEFFYTSFFQEGIYIHRKTL